MYGGGRGWFRWRQRAPGGRRSVAAALLLWQLAAPAAAAASPHPITETAALGARPPAGVDVASAALIENPSRWDGRIVSFAGEAVGEAMIRGNHAWLQVNDDAYQARTREPRQRLAGYNSGQAIWAPLALAQRVRLFGEYRAEGDAVRLLGEFHAACREHGGDMDIHATDLEVVREGRALAQRPNTGRLGIGLGLLAFSGVLLTLRVRRGRRAR